MALQKVKPTAVAPSSSPMVPMEVLLTGGGMIYGWDSKLDHYKFSGLVHYSDDGQKPSSRR